MMQDLSASLFYAQAADRLTCNRRYNRLDSEEMSDFLDWKPDAGYMHQNEEEEAEEVFRCCSA